MTKKDKQNKFLKYLAQIYLENPNLTISDATIYHELVHFDFGSKQNAHIKNNSLVSIQVKLNNEFQGKSCHCFNNNYFWVIENRRDLNDSGFYRLMENSIKLYIPIDSENFYHIASQLFTFMLEKNIIMQSKVAKVMRNDALVVRISSSKEAEDVINYLESLNYKSKVETNPFLVNDNNSQVSLARDGHISYNTALTKLIREYLKNKQKSHNLNDISAKEFANFIIEKINLSFQDKEIFANTYDLRTAKEFKDFLSTSNLISQNILTPLNKEQLFNYHYDYQEKESPHLLSLTTEEQKLLYIINKMCSYYSISEVHMRILEYISKENVNYFTRRDGIRALVNYYFPPYKIKTMLKDMSWNAFLSASLTTMQKYDYNQLLYAIDNLLKEEKIDGFTNQNNVRSYLGIILIPELFQELLEEKGISITSSSLADIVICESKKFETTKKVGKK